MKRNMKERYVSRMKDYCYELSVIFSPTIEGDRQQHYDALRTLLTDHGCNILDESDWGLRNFAYPIKKNTKGYYLFVRFKSNSDVPKAISHEMKLDERILRTMIIKQEVKSTFGPVAEDTYKTEELDLKVEEKEENVTAVEDVQPEIVSEGDVQENIEDTGVTEEQITEEASEESDDKE